jgi:hypothetical protein
MRLIEYLRATEQPYKKGVQHEEEDKAREDAKIVNDTMKAGGPVSMPKKAFVKEHVHLVKVLRKGSQQEREKEAKEQGDELKHLKAGGPGSGRRPGFGKPKTIGVDFDGTLAYHVPGTGHYGRLGHPIPQMVAKVRRALNQGNKVIVFTARPVEDHPRLAAWTKQHIGQELEVTNVKQPHIQEYWDDRARAIKRNKGVFADGTVTWSSPSGPGGADYSEIYYNIQPITNDHPPSLKNPVAVKKPYAQDGWKRGDSAEAQKQARKDLATIHSKLRRQFGKPEIAETALFPLYPNLRQDI